MMPHHQETLAYHGLAPNTEYYDMSDQTEDQDTQTETNTMGQGTQTEINTVSQGIGTEYTSRSQGTETENSSPMDTTTETGTQAAMAPWWGPIRRYKPPVRSSPLQGTQVAVRQAGVTIQAMDDDAATVDYEFLEADRETVDYNDPLEVDDHEMRTSTKRMADTDEEKKKKPKLYPMAAPKPKIKKEGERAKPAAATQSETDDEVQISAVQPNKNNDINFWKEQSANELRAQLKLRDLQKFRDEWAFKSKDQLLQIIQDMISKGTW
jgi:hypothetical protein